MYRKPRQNPVLFLLFVAQLILLSSCDALLNPKSLFSSLDKPDTSTIAGKTGTSLLDALADQNSSQKFYDALSSSEKSEIDSKLATLETGTDPAIKSKAALARVELLMHTNAAVTNTINSLSDLLLPANGESTDSFSTADMIVKLTTPLDSIKNDQTALIQFLSDMSTISASYGNVTRGNVDAGDLQIFMVAAVFDTITGFYSSPSSAATALGTFLQDPQNPDLSKLLPADVDEEKFQDKLTGTGATAKVNTLETLATIAGLQTLADKIKSAVNGNN